MNGLEQLYQQVILDHSRQRTGNLPLTGGAPGESFGSSHQLNPVCGDEITLEVHIGADGSHSVRWDGDGCSISMASASVLSELVEESAPEELVRIEAAFYELMHSRGKGEADEELLGDAAAFVGVSKFPARVKCALLSWVAFKDALLQAHSLTPEERK
ncbi:SUF system NifU family Fe-S cluster assembly protein [Brevibacterium sp. 50QC2O2]|uniref:Fe-S cluster assembly sulfur transfer protein SufU n=1 Tax=Brevibacterium TaxID=1696 RepID=UPI00211CAFA2|nr:MULTISPECIES: SUF system NifU family Fe-S cluster assembly protein [unclassified Brevibacterium]MCQ9384311.1 SUF system NifU family Fe-S cluster assembly protein [Brevibacterium sp. 68QC2CO]MCQ9388930.1 SUF system NifU family Fe-S cluster assembly protein [Brevibacterium sp. 50QC2O2]